MTKMNVTYARLQGPIFIPNGPGQFGPELTIDKTGTKRIETMVIDESFLTVQMTVNGKITNIVIPTPMVSCAVVERKLESTK